MASSFFHDRLPGPWRTHAQPYQAEPVGQDLILHEFGRYLHDVARSGDRAELEACLAAVEDALAGDAAAAVVDQVLGAVVHMPGFPFDWPLGPRTLEALGR